MAGADTGDLMEIFFGHFLGGVLGVRHEVPFCGYDCGRGDIMASGRLMLLIVRLVVYDAR